jgi:VRR-NUC domain
VREKDVLKVVTDLLDLNHWDWWHVPMPMVAERSGRGFRPYKKAGGLPDIFAFHRDPPRMLILELKGKGGKLSDDQRRFLALARDVAERARQHGSETWHLPDERPVGVYVVEPHTIEAISQVIRTRVLT